MLGLVARLGFSPKLIAGGLGLLALVVLVFMASQSSKKADRLQAELEAERAASAIDKGVTNALEDADSLDPAGLDRWLLDRSNQPR